MSMNTTVTSFILTKDEREAMQRIADTQYGGSVSQTIRAALAAQYPALATATKSVRRPGGQYGEKRPRKKA